MMAVNAYINFDGNCREAVDFYTQVFGTKPPKIMTFGQMQSDPSFPVPEHMKDRVAHTNLDICGTNVMFSDVFEGMPYTQGNHMSLAVVSDDKEKLKTFFEGLAQGGRVEMPLQETEWSGLYGSVVDKYGICWQINLQT